MISSYFLKDDSLVKVLVAFTITIVSVSSQAQQVVDEATAVTDEQRVLVEETEESVEEIKATPQYTDLQELRDFDRDLADVSSAPTRSYKQTFKDEVMSFCLSIAYQDIAEISDDAFYTAAAYHSWGRYEFDEVLDKVPTLVSAYLNKPYRNESEERKELAEDAEQSIQTKQPQLFLLKCLDLYHGPELEALAIEYVRDPDRSYAEDHSYIP